MRIVDINFNDMVGNSVNFRNNDELKELVELFAKHLKLKKYNSSVYNLEIHIYTAKFEYCIVEKQTNKFTIVKEDNYNNRQFSYVEII